MRTNRYFPADGGRSLPGRITWVVAACAVAFGSAAWITDSNPLVRMSDAAASKDASKHDTATSFDARFLEASVAGSLSSFASSTLAPPPVRSEPPELTQKREQGKALLARKLQSQLLFQDARAALVDGAPVDDLRPSVASSQVPSIVAAVPLPRSRPVEASLETANRAVAVQTDERRTEDRRTEDRSLLQKLTDLLPPRLTLASLAPDGGLLRSRPDLAALGYDNLTAVYDISARAVYMPDGATLEAHSGLGGLMDDPARVAERNAGATPPNVYELKPREQLFHGVQALRMTPVGEQGTLGRSGLLAHGYMLGPNGDSNGCVSIRNYEAFLAAYTRGEIKRLVVVPKLGEPKPGESRFGDSRPGESRPGDSRPGESRPGDETPATRRPT